ncbi:MAG: pilus assembly protein PilM [Candidatus Paceibacterota bacterium]
MNTRYLELAQHHATGVMLSDTALRFVALTHHDHSVIPGAYAELVVPQGSIVNGKIVDKSRFINFLKASRKAYKFEQINLVLNSPQIQTFSLSVKGAGQLYVKEAVEKEFGLSIKDIVYDYKVIGADSQTTVLQATAVPKNLSQEFVTAFKQAGITVMSIESIGHALSRDLLPANYQGTTLIVSIDTFTTSITYVVNGRVSQTTLIEFGDAMMTNALMEKLSVDSDEADRLKREQGLIARDSRKVFDAIVDDCATLVHHINESYITWKTTHGALSTLETVYLSGQGSIVKGLDEYISAGLRLPVQLGNVWSNCLSFDDHVPVIPQHIAVRFDAAIGVALVGQYMTNLIPNGHAQHLRRKHVARLSGKIILSFIFGVAVGVGVSMLIAFFGLNTRIVEILHKIPTRW